MITIGTVKFDFKADNEEFYRSLYKEWDGFFRTSFEEIAEEVMSYYDMENEILTIDSISVNLGTIMEQDFYQHFPMRLREALHQYFRELLTRGDTASFPGVRRVSTEKNALDLLCFFLLHGYLPFYADKGLSDVNVLLEKVLQTAPYDFKAFLESYAHYDFLHKRLVFQFDDQQLKAIVDKVHPSEAKFTNLYTHMQILTYKQSKKLNNSYSRLIKWEFIFAVVYHAPLSPFNRTQFLLGIIKRLAAHYNLSVIEILRFLLVDQELNQLSFKLNVIPILDELLQKFSGSDTGGNDTVPHPLPVKNSIKRPSNREKNNIHLKPNSMNADLPELQKDDFIQIANAGLVLPYPFYSRLFSQLKLFKDGTQEFKDDEAHVKAIFLLQYVAYGDSKEEFQEQELFFSKFLMGYGDKPLPKSYPITDTEKKSVNDMLKSIKQFWTKLENSSILAIQESFVRRNGILKERDQKSGYELHVEEKAFDVLLDYLPWSINIVKLMNSKGIIYVKWRNT